MISKETKCPFCDVNCPESCIIGNYPYKIPYFWDKRSLGWDRQFNEINRLGIALGVSGIGHRRA